jgi:hypothetical protein
MNPPCTVEVVDLDQVLAFRTGGGDHFEHESDRAGIDPLRHRLRGEGFRLGDR